jgi:hypothetical protein
MDNLFTQLPHIIGAAAQSMLGTFALLVVALAVLAYVFFAKAREKVKVGIFVLLFVGVLLFGVAMFKVSTGMAMTNAPPSTQTAAKPALSKEAKALLLGASEDPAGMVLFERYGAGVDLHTNDVSYLTDKGDHELMATWEAALQELVQAGLFAARGDRGEIFEITKAGYDAAKREKDSAEQVASLPAPSDSEKVLACTYISIKSLGWSEGHKTNFCIANGYPQGNANRGEHSNGGICMSGETKICEASAFEKLQDGYACEIEGNRTACYRVANK